MSRPNVLVVLVDDMGYSDIGCYGGEIRTPAIDRLAREGARFSQFYNTARCSPSRASLITGLHPHQTGIGVLTNDDRPRGYPGTINKRCVTIAEVLKAAGYATCLAGKWHLASEMRNPNDAWPTRRGFDRFYGTLTGCGSFFQPGTLTRDEANVEDEALAPGYFYTDAITDEACAFLREHAASQPAQPFFLYVAYTAPHWPLHARDEDLARYRGAFDAGWDALRERRMARLRRRGLGRAVGAAERARSDAARVGCGRREGVGSAAHGGVRRSDRPDGPGRRAHPRRARARRPARRHTRDLPVGQRRLGRGAAAGRARALQAAQGHPAHCDARRARGEDRQRAVDRARRRGHLRELRARVGEPVEHAVPLLQARTCTKAASRRRSSCAGRAAASPRAASCMRRTSWSTSCRRSSRRPARATRRGTTATTSSPARAAACSLRCAATTQPTARSTGSTPATPQSADGRWKLVRDYPKAWELYDIERDRTELHDLASAHPDVVADLSGRWQAWADRVGVLPWTVTEAIYAERGLLPREALG